MSTSSPSTLEGAQISSSDSQRREFKRLQLSDRSIQIYEHTHTHTHTHTHMDIHTCAHTHTDTHGHTHTHKHGHTHMCTHTQTYTQTHIHGHTHMHTQCSSAQHKARHSAKRTDLEHIILSKTSQTQREKNLCGKTVWSPWALHRHGPYT